MSDEKMVTEREAVLRERAAAQNAIVAVFGRDGARLPNNWEGSITVAARMYPLPKVTRPREVKDPLEWRIMWSVRDDVIVGDALDSGHWYPLSSGHSAFLPISSRVRVWADLLANPTEEVEDDA